MHPVELCQMCVAFGLVYLGLKVARYRIRTYEAIVNGIEDLDEIDVKSLAYADLLVAKSRFAVYHHMIADFIKMLPKKYIDLVPESLAELAKDKETSAKMRLFKFYASNSDNVFVFILSVFLPIVIMSMFHFDWLVPDDIASNTTPAIIFNTLIYIAMVLPGLFVLLGIRMYTNMENRIREAVEYIAGEFAISVVDTDITPHKKPPLTNNAMPNKNQA